MHVFALAGLDADEPLATLNGNPKSNTEDIVFEIIVDSDGNIIATGHSIMLNWDRDVLWWKIPT